jgi:hypothetical protein
VWRVWTGAVPRTRQGRAACRARTFRGRRRRRHKLRSGPLADQLVVDRRDVELVVDAQVLGNHVVGGAHEIATRLEVVDADRGAVGHDFLLDHEVDEPARIEARERPHRVVCPHGHDETIQLLLGHGAQVVVDRNVDELIAVGDHQRVIVVDELARGQHRAGGALGDAVELHDRAAGRPGLKALPQPELLRMRALTDEHETMRSRWPDVIDHQPDHRHAVNRDQRLGQGVTRFGETASEASQRDDDVYH